MRRDTHGQRLPSKAQRSRACKLLCRVFRPAVEHRWRAMLVQLECSSIYCQFLTSYPAALHHPKKIGRECDNKHKATSRQLFYRSRVGHASIPLSVRSIVSARVCISECNHANSRYRSYHQTSRLDGTGCLLGRSQAFCSCIWRCTSQRMHAPASDTHTQHTHTHARTEYQARCSELSRAMAAQ